MKKWILIVVAIMFMGTQANAGGIFKDKSDIGHFLAGIFVQEKLEDIRNKERIEEEIKNKQTEERIKAEYERADKEREESVRVIKNIEVKEERSQLRVLFNVHRQVVREVLEESYEAENFILDIYEKNDKDTYRTSREIEIFVIEYFREAFGYDAHRMFDMWTRTKFQEWLDSKYRVMKKN